jgi:hypothetical protein
MVRNRLVLLVDGSGTVVASETTMFYQDELGGGLHGWGRFLHFAMISWAKNRELGRVTCIPDGKGVEGVRLAMPAVSCTCTR